MTTFIEEFKTLTKNLHVWPFNENLVVMRNTVSLVMFKVVLTNVICEEFAFLLWILAL